MTLKHTIYMYTANFDRKKHFVIWGHEFIIDLRKSMKLKLVLVFKEKPKLLPSTTNIRHHLTIVLGFFCSKSHKQENIPLCRINPSDAKKKQVTP